MEQVINLSSLHDFLTNHNIYYTGHYLALINNTLSTALSHNMYLSSLFKGVITNNHFDGNDRPEGTAYDIGAYEFSE